MEFIGTNPSDCGIEPEIAVKVIDIEKNSVSELDPDIEEDKGNPLVSKAAEEILRKLLWGALTAAGKAGALERGGYVLVI